MLFVYPDERPRTFWMKDTSLPLSIAYLDAQGRIVRIADMDALRHEPGAVRAARDVRARGEPGLVHPTRRAGRRLREGRASPVLALIGASPGQRAMLRPHAQSAHVDGDRLGVRHRVSIPARPSPSSCDLRRRRPASGSFVTTVEVPCPSRRASRTRSTVGTRRRSARRVTGAYRRSSTCSRRLSALGVDNVDVGFVRGPEVPVLDGSAQPWVDAIRAGRDRRAGRPTPTTRDRARDRVPHWAVASRASCRAISSRLSRTDRFDHARIGARRSPFRSRTASSATRSHGRAPSLPRRGRSDEGDGAHQGRLARETPSSTRRTERS
jgi:hypothetical protein